MAAETSYLVDPPGGYFALLTTCHTCMDTKANTCPDCEVSTSVTITGGSGGGDFGGFPYQFKSSTLTLGCDASCAYLVRIQYKLETSSARRSFFQCGFSDIWLVERWPGISAGDDTYSMDEMFVVATSLPFDLDNDEIASDYGGIPGGRLGNSGANAAQYFNPYGLRERYDQLSGNKETHCGTLMFFAMGDDIIKFRLAQHTATADNINPNGYDMINGDAATQQDYQHGEYGSTGAFVVKVFTRPIPGKLDLTKPLQQLAKYHPKLVN